MSTGRETKVRATELVPIADRLRYMQVFRVAAIAITAAVAASAPHAMVVPAGALASATGLYVVIAGAAELVARYASGRATTVFGGMLIVDGIYLAYASYATGGPASLVRWAILLHLITVSLLASYRTGLKLALWHSLLLIVAFYAERSGILHHVGGGLGIGTPFQRLIEFAALFWLIAIVTATFAAINERELRRRRYDLEALAGMAGRLETISEPVEVAEAIVEATVDTFGFSRAVIAGAPAGELPRVLGSHRASSRESCPEHPGPASVISVAERERRTLLVSHLDRQQDAWLTTLLPDAQNVVVVPLTAERNSFGTLVAEQPHRAGSRIERRIVSMVERFVSHGALALRNAWLLDQIRWMATIDGLTGLANRSSFDETLAKELARAARHSDDVSLLMVDIDHFKRLNDTHGHQVGDQVLRRVAAELAGQCRATDVAARYGGEEFALVLPATSRNDAAVVAERLVERIGGALAERAVTVSIGAATFPVDGTTPQALVEAADDALYESKRAGRNRITSAHRAEPLVSDIVVQP